MEFKLSDENKKKLKEILHKNKIYDVIEDWKDKIHQHLEEKHFKSLEEILNYLILENGTIVPDNNMCDMCQIKHVKFQNEIDKIEVKYFDSVLDLISIEYFINQFYFTFMKDSRGYIPNWHKNI